LCDSVDHFGEISARDWRSVDTHALSPPCTVGTSSAAKP
jgi:hypothetical protein